MSDIQWRSMSLSLTWRLTAPRPANEERNEQRQCQQADDNGISGPRHSAKPFLGDMTQASRL